MIRHMTLTCALMIFSAPAFADTPDGILDHYRKAAQTEDAKFQNFSAERGKAFYFSEHKDTGEVMSCASCHSDNAKGIGKTRAGKEIKPIAPAANAKRFTELKKVEKWFKRNCKDVLARPCTSQEKGDFLTYLLSVQ